MYKFPLANSKYMPKLSYICNLIKRKINININ